ncbi:MAG TPA: hypothetical protein VMS77_04535 [Conexivisphaerales archaeon]|nr:hypothetical protein [Conexivisphaerales archaeon]
MIVYGDPSGGRLDIASAELEALFEAAGEKVRASRDGTIVTCEARFLPGWLATRAAFLNDVGVLLWKGKSDEAAEQAKGLDFQAMEGSRFKVDAEGFDADRKRAVDEDFGGRVLTTAPSSSVSLREPQVVVRVVARGGQGFVGLSGPKGKGKWVERRPRARAFFHPSALFPKLARLMVNLTAVPSGATFLDPFSGTCSTVIEASLVGAYSLGADVDKKMVFGGRRNLRKLSLEESSQVLRSDARALPFREVDAIAGDVPYGRASSTKGATSAVLMSDLLSQADGCLKMGGRLVVMHQKGSPLEKPKGFELLGEYEFYVHRSLTRVISVLRRSS